jgi:hypothetical protein
MWERIAIRQRPEPGGNACTSSGRPPPNRNGPESNITLTIALTPLIQVHALRLYLNMPEVYRPLAMRSFLCHPTPSKSINGSIVLKILSSFVI